MEFNLTTIMAIISIVFCIATFVLNRKDKAINDTKDENRESSNQMLIDYRLTQVEHKLDKILDILDSYEDETKKIVQEEIDKHVLKYHN